MYLRKACASIAALALTAGGLALMAPGVATAAAGDKLTQFQLNANGYGTTVSALAGVVDSGKTANVGFGCTRRVPIDKDNNVADADLGPIGDVGAITTHVTAEKVGDRVETESETHIADASLLSGAIQLTGLNVIARTFHTPDGGYEAETEATFTSLVIGGEEITVIGDEEQTITLPGIATIVVNGSQTKERQHFASARVQALKITLLSGTGAKVVVGSASAGIDGRDYEGTFSGGGWGSTIEVLGQIESGKTAKKSLPCLGTNGEDRTNSTANADAGVVEIGAIETTVNGDASVPEATVTNHVADVTVELGVAELRIEGVTTQVHVIEVDGEVVADLGDSGVASIVIDPLVGPEIVIPVDVEPGTTIALPLGLGSITFFEVFEYKGDRGLGLLGLQIDLPLIDTNVTVGSAKAAIK